MTSILFSRSRRSVSSHVGNLLGCLTTLFLLALTWYGMIRLLFALWSRL